MGAHPHGLEDILSLDVYQNPPSDTTFSLMENVAPYDDGSGNDVTAEDGTYTVDLEFGPDDDIGVYKYKIIVKDKKNNETESGILNIDLENHAPTFSLNYTSSVSLPTGSDTLYEVLITVTDDSSTPNITLALRGSRRGSSPPTMPPPASDPPRGDPRRGGAGHWDYR